MSRLEKKCFVGSALAHGLLAVVLVLAPAFLAPEKKPPAAPILKVIPAKIVDDLLGGGAPVEVAPPPPAPVVVPPTPAPQPQPPPPPVEAVRPPEPRPAPEIVQPPPPTPRPAPSLAPAPKRPKIVKAESKKAPEPPQKEEKPRIDVSLDSVQITAPKQDARKKKADEEAKRALDEARREREAAERARKKRAEQIKGLIAKVDETSRDVNIETLKEGLSRGTEVRIPGPNKGAFASYAQVVKSIYDAAWRFTDDMADTGKTVEVTITVDKSGDVLSARITQRSGNAALDNSVEEVLRRVKHIRPFPAGATEERRTFELNFNPRLKRLTG